MSEMGRREVFKGLVAAALAGAGSMEAEARSEKRVMGNLDRTAQEYLLELSKLHQHWQQVTAWLEEDFGSEETRSVMREEYKDYDDILEIVNEINVLLKEMESQLEKFTNANLAEKEEVISSLKQISEQYTELEQELGRIHDYHIWFEERRLRQEEDNKEEIET